MRLPLTGLFRLRDALGRQGRPAAKMVNAGRSLTTVAYVVGERPELDDDGEVMFPETHIVYAFDEPSLEERKAVSLHMEGREVDAAGRWRDHPLTPDGHLAFWPMVVPSAWRLMGESGELVELRPCEEEFRRVEVGGGRVVVLDTSGSESIRQSFVFPPIVLDALSDDALVGTAAVASDDLSRKGLEPSIRLTRVLSVGFVHEPVGVYEIDIHPARSPWRRRTYVWIDCLGYAWDATYTFRVGSEIDWQKMFEEMEAGSA